MNKYLVLIYESSHISAGNLLKNGDVLYQNSLQVEEQPILSGDLLEKQKFLQNNFFPQKSKAGPLIPGHQIYWIKIQDWDIEYDNIICQTEESKH